MPNSSSSAMTGNAEECLLPRLAILDLGLHKYSEINIFNIKKLDRYKTDNTKKTLHWTVRMCQCFMRR